MALVASALGRYPFEGRLLLFLAPAVLMLVAEGLVALHRLVRQQLPWLMPLAGALLLTGMTLEASALALSPTREELRPILEELRELPGDGLYISHGAAEATRYYLARQGPPRAPLIYGGYLRGDLPAIEAELRALPRGRIWLVYSHVHRDNGVDEEQFSLHILDQLGRRLRVLAQPGATAYQYELGEPLRAGER
jgi:hypothetical protein